MATRLAALALKTLFALLVLASALGWASLAVAQPGVPGVEARDPAVQLVRSKCVRLIRRGGQEHLVNTCGSCKLVQVKRERQGVLGPPSLRTYTVLEGGSFTLQFKGPGRTRIATEQPCASPSQDYVSPDQQVVADPGSIDCIHPVSVPGRGMMLANLCQECRAVVVERTKTGRPAKHEAVTLPAQSMAPLAAKGYSGGRLLREGACR